jgi:hypothetical protein
MNQDQRRKGRGFAQCPKSRMKPHAAVRLLRDLSNLKVPALKYAVSSQSGNKPTSNSAVQQIQLASSLGV